MNDDDVLRHNLQKSPDVLSGDVRLIREYGHPTAGQAYNAGLAHAASDLVAFVHQDVYLPAGWTRRLIETIEWLDQTGARWGVIGVWGVTKSGDFCGRVWCSGGNKQHAGAPGVNRVESVDEIVLVTRTSSGLRFDPALPGFHLYATDLALRASELGLGTYVFDGPVVHNSKDNSQPLDGHYWNAYRYMQRKWRSQLPVRTCVVPVTRLGLPLWKQWAKNEVRRRRMRAPSRERLLDAHLKARDLGYENVPAIQ